MDINRKGVEPLDDDILDAVAGGAASGMTPEQAKAQAAADGRPDKLDIGAMLCSCDNKYKFCKRVPVSIRLGNKIMRSYEYRDQKCYMCGAAKEK